MSDEMPMVHLEASKLGDPEYITHEVRASELRFTGDAADYVAGILSAMRAERTLKQMTGVYAEIYSRHADAGMSRQTIQDLLDEFARNLLSSDAVKR